MMLPGSIALLTPIFIGFVFGPEVLGGFLAGATVSGVLMGIFKTMPAVPGIMQKSFEKGVEINGEMHYKKSEPHKASVTGDTVGDPFKDTSGPSMNILIKLMSIVSLVIAPTIAKLHFDKIQSDRKAKIETLIQMDKLNETAHLTAADIMAPTPVNPETNVSMVNGRVDEAGDFVYDLGQITEVTLPNQTKINLGSNSRMLTLSKDLQNKEAKLLDKSNWYTIENLYFESGSANLKETSKKRSIIYTNY